uniref:Uncharacterized protein n=1 Tax=Arion vulgaris TaxID=1028688 RepID=A0A0B7AYL2_9EUPU
MTHPKKKPCTHADITFCKATIISRKICPRIVNTYKQINVQASMYQIIQSRKLTEHTKTNKSVSETEEIN